MHPKIRSLGLTLTLTLLSLMGLYTLEVRSFRNLVGLGQDAKNDPRKVEADRLFGQGNQQFYVSQFEAALQSWQQALSIYRRIKDRRGEGNAFGNLGLYRSLGDYAKAIEFSHPYYWSPFILIGNGL